MSHPWLAFVAYILLLLDSAALVLMGWPGAAFSDMESFAEHFCRVSSCKASSLDGRCTFIFPLPTPQLVAKLAQT